MGRRDQHDEHWTAVRKAVHQRDRERCRAYGCLSPKEQSQLVGVTEKNLDCAHVYAVSESPEFTYRLSNIYLLFRTLHRRMDNYHDLVTDEDCDLNTHFYWWYRIIKKAVIKYDSSIDYELLVKEYIKKFNLDY